MEESTKEIIDVLTLGILKTLGIYLYINFHDNIFNYLIIYVTNH